MNASSVSAEAPYRHIVLFKFKESATPEQVKGVEEAFKALPGKIDTIVDFEWGTNVSPEGKDDGFTHCFFVTFKDKAGLEVYLPHPDHKAFGAGLREILDKVLVVDYVATK
ncbi:Dabb family protein [Phragmitibacter flavus]|nr:Dabb family protein [Phragmitibacter flavus]